MIKARTRTTKNLSHQNFYNSPVKTWLPCKVWSAIYYVRGQILELPLEILWPMASFHLFSRALRKSLFPQYPLSSWRILTWKLAVRRQGRPGGTQGTGTGSAENHIWPHFIFYVQWTLQKYTAATARLESGAGRQAKDSFTVEYMY